MKTITNRAAWVFVLGVGMLLGHGWRSAFSVVLADDLRAVTPTAAGPQTATPAKLTQAEHLRRAAEHLEAGGQSALALHVRQMATSLDGQFGSNPPKAFSAPHPMHLPGQSWPSPLYGHLPPIPEEAVPPGRLAPMTADPLPRWSIKPWLPPELDDGHMRWVVPARSQIETREVRAVPAPQRDPI